MSSTTQDQKWTAIITPKKKLFNFSLKDLWLYRDFILLSVRRDLITTHKQTVLGPLWYLIQPLVSTVVYQIIFGNIIGISTNQIPPFLFFMSGVVIWYYFSACLNRTTVIFSANAHIFSKVYFPRLAMPIAGIISSAWQFLIQFAIFIGFYIFFLAKGAPIEFSYRIIIIPVLFIQTALLGLGSGCLIAALTTRFKDLQMATASIIQFWMYGSCIFFPLSSVPEHFQKILIFNPVVPIIESFRFAMMGQGSVEIWQWLVSLAITLIILAFGLIEFGRAEKTVADTI